MRLLPHLTVNLLSSFARVFLWPVCFLFYQTCFTTFARTVPELRFVLFHFLWGFSVYYRHFHPGLHKIGPSRIPPSKAKEIAGKRAKKCRSVPNRSPPWGQKSATNGPYCTYIMGEWVYVQFPRPVKVSLISHIFFEFPCIYWLCRCHVMFWRVKRCHVMCSKYDMWRACYMHLNPLPIEAHLRSCRSLFSGPVGAFIFRHVHLLCLPFCNRLPIS